MNEDDEKKIKEMLRPGDYALFKALSSYIEKHDAEIEEEHKHGGYAMLAYMTVAFVIANLIIWLLTRA